MGDDPGIMDVWADNLEEAFEAIRQVVDDFTYVSMDTEFPGIVARPIGTYSKSEYNYQTLRCNVDMLRLIQLGITFANEKGDSPPNVPTTLQFHFRFDLGDEMYSAESIDMLKRAGIDFKRHGDGGIELEDFAELLISSGLVMNPAITWIAFHSGYDLGYLLKLLTQSPLPKRQADFFDAINAFFPIIYDVKYMMKSCRNLKGGLQEIADHMEVRRIGPQHQAGSDSLLTMAVFFKMRRLYFEDTIDADKYGSVLFGLGISWVPNSNNSVAGMVGGSDLASASSGAAGVARPATPPGNGHYILAPGTVTGGNSGAVAAAAAAAQGGSVTNHEWTSSTTS